MSDLDTLMLEIACVHLGYNPEHVDHSSMLSHRPDDGVEEFIITIVTHRTNMEEMHEWADANMPSVPENVMRPQLIWDTMLDVVQITIVDEILVHTLFSSQVPFPTYDPRFPRRPFSSDEQDSIHGPIFYRKYIDAMIS